MKVYTNVGGVDLRAPIKSWCETPDDSALEQASHLAQLPFLVRHVALMPDTHMGYGMPIGGVVALDGAISPNMVGVDIGCGMHAVRTSLTHIELDQLKKVMGIIREKIPVGFAHRATPQPSWAEEWGMRHVVRQEYESSLKQMGTLGGGNHFIEIQRDEAGAIWFMIHSGSRNLGKKVADHYNKIAKELNTEWHSAVPAAWDLAFMPLQTQYAQEYLEEMEMCLRFAKRNRETMAECIKIAFLIAFPSCTFDADLDIHHNYAAIEHHYGKNVMVHRKGATAARAGELGIIPGSQGTASYIVEGLGNPESFMSCSHGAGRRLGRKEACRSLKLEEEQQKLNASGIVHSVRNASDLDEAPGAYKDIETVMAEQADLVKVTHKLTPLGVIKG